MSSEMAQIADFRRWLGEQHNINNLLQNSSDSLVYIAHEYTRTQVHQEVEKYTVLDLLLEDGGEKLLVYLNYALEKVGPLVDFNHRFAAECEENWYLCAYWKNRDQQYILQEKLSSVFGPSHCVLLKTEDPTEVVVFYSVDGLPMSAVNDLTGRCLNAFLKLRLDRYRSGQLAHKIQDSHTGQLVNDPIYSGLEAERRVFERNIICKLCRVTKQSLDKFNELPELMGCEGTSIDFDDPI